VLQVQFLDTLFADGSAYVLGPEDKDCWYLYTLLPVEGEYAAVQVRHHDALIHQKY